MSKNQKSYTPEFKQQIVDLYNAGGTSYPKLSDPDVISIVNALDAIQKQIE